MEVGSCRETDEIKSAVNIEDTVAIVLTTQKQHYLETGPNPGSFPMKPSTASFLRGNTSPHRARHQPNRSRGMC
jgi:hypothetical protein